jgi:hypothetical protein
MRALLNVLEEFVDNDCFDKISESSKARTLTKTDYEHLYEVPVTELRCMISGISHSSIMAAAAASSSPKPKSPVTLFYLLPRRAKAKEKNSLGYVRH